MLVLGRIHRAAQRIGHCPKLGLVPGRGAAARPRRRSLPLLPRSSPRHAPPHPLRSHCRPAPRRRSPVRTRPLAQGRQYHVSPPALNALWRWIFVSSAMTARHITTSVNALAAMPVPGCPIDGAHVPQASQIGRLKLSAARSPTIAPPPMGGASDLWRSPLRRPSRYRNPDLLQRQLGAGLNGQLAIGPRQSLQQIGHLPQAELEEVVVQLPFGSDVYSADADQKPRLRLCVGNRSDQTQHHVMVSCSITRFYLNANAILAKAEGSPCREDIDAAVWARR